MRGKKERGYGVGWRENKRKQPAEHSISLTDKNKQTKNPLAVQQKTDGKSKPSNQYKIRAE